MELNPGPLTDKDIAPITAFNLELFKKADILIKKAELANPSIQKMSDFQKNQLTIKYLRMHENPDEFMMQQRFL